eukprot:302404-Chlamydomonas_euryale.AAC.1
MHVLPPPPPPSDPVSKRRVSWVGGGGRVPLAELQMMQLFLETRCQCVCGITTLDGSASAS